MDHAVLGKGTYNIPVQAENKERNGKTLEIFGADHLNKIMTSGREMDQRYSNNHSRHTASTSSKIFGIRVVEFGT